MKLIKTIICVIAILILAVILWFLINFPTKECTKNEDCIPANPLIDVQYLCDNGLCKTKPLGNECINNEDCIPETPLVGVQYLCDNGTCKTKPFGNPASQYCIDNGGSTDIRTNPDGSQYGVCVFSDGSECDEWEYYNGECQSGTIFLKTTCRSDNDCVPEFCCHSSTCVNLEHKPNCTDIFCTQECMPGTMDCGQGRCVCLNNTCRVEWTS